MMGKKIIFALLFANSFFVNAQHVKKMKTFPKIFGCDHLLDNNELKKCFNQNINYGIQNEIDFFANIADYLHINSTVAKLNFSISTEGKFINTHVGGINPIFNSFVWSSILIIQNKMDDKKLTIQPALDEKGNPMDVTLSVPVRFQSQINPNVYANFPADERVLFTIDFEDEIIEIRMNRDYLIKTFGINNNREFYLGKYNNFFELATVEPYASKINESFRSGITFITKGLVDDKEYTIQMRNFFSNNAEQEFLIEVFHEENDTWTEYYAYKTKEEFNQSKFATLTYR